MTQQYPPGQRGRETPDPRLIREGNVADIVELGFPAPPDGFPLVWDAGDRVALRPTGEIEARAAVLNTVIAATLGAPPELTAGWVEANGLRTAATRPEWLFLSERQGPAELYGLHIEALWALAWLLGVAEELDPSQYCGDGLALWLPDLAEGETFEAWQYRSASEPRPAEEAASLLDLHYCLDWGHVQALMDGRPFPGTTQPYVIGQRRWALEWATVFLGPYHDPPQPWDEVDLIG
jgi:hypothetical protein